MHQALLSQFSALAEFFIVKVQVKVQILVNLTKNFVPFSVIKLITLHGLEISSVVQGDANFFYNGPNS